MYILYGIWKGNLEYILQSPLKYQTRTYRDFIQIQAL